MRGVGTKMKQGLEMLNKIKKWLIKKNGIERKFNVLVSLTGASHDSILIMIDELIKNSLFIGVSPDRLVMKLLKDNSEMKAALKKIKNDIYINQDSRKQINEIIDEVLG